MRVKAERRRWSGHGEGGVTAHVVFDLHVGSVYHATEAEHKEAEAIAERINKQLEEAGL